MSNITTLIVVGAVMFAVLGGVTLLSHIYSLNSIKSRTVGDGQHGTARWATKREIRKTYANNCAQYGEVIPRVVGVVPP